MQFILFYHSLVSDWNHGNAHFLRGVVTELMQRGHEVVVYEPRDGWSLENLRREQGDAPLAEFQRVYPHLKTNFYDPQSLDLEQMLDNADVVLVHEWNEHELVRRIGEHRAGSRHYRLLFHDTHHRSVTDPDSIASYDLTHYDGVLAFGDIIRDRYLQEGWAARAWTWHEAADDRVFYPRTADHQDLDLTWVGNWGDNERTEELLEFLLEPVRRLQLRAVVHGVRYPDEARQALVAAGIRYGSWLPNFRAPQLFARAKVTVHVPRRPYRESLPGIPTIRVFEALSCGIPLVTAPWEDAEQLFTPGEDYLVARDGREMQQHLRDILHDPRLATSLAEHGRRTILQRHTCRHRVDELLAVCEELELPKSTAPLLATSDHTATAGRDAERSDITAQQDLV